MAACWKWGLLELFSTFLLDLCICSQPWDLDLQERAWHIRTILLDQRVFLSSLLRRWWNVETAFLICSDNQSCFLSTCSKGNQRLEKVYLGTGSFHHLELRIWEHCWTYSLYRVWGIARCLWGNSHALFLRKCSLILQLLSFLLWYSHSMHQDLLWYLATLIWNGGDDQDFQPCARTEIFPWGRQTRVCLLSSLQAYESIHLRCRFLPTYISCWNHEAAVLLSQFRGTMHLWNLWARRHLTEVDLC